ncbi:hypothetical protein RIF29_24555 [Crotalaria pallida]|uniref:Xyloglucan endotransglucosylase/hydrolase n=1 Tax=Crotalaria pallida TaxID=3830 RepID=A0AAN9EJX6_CROPI
MFYSYLSLLLLFSLLASLQVKGANESKYVPFEQNYAPSWGNENVRVLNQGSEVQLTLDQHSGSGFQSLQKYASGWFSFSIKMPPKDSTAVITTFYLSSNTGNSRDEIDLEFLGGNKDLPYILQTNIYQNGQGGREQRISLWFDPTTDFHSYDLLWNEHQLVFFVDNTPIRVFKNTTSKGGHYPTLGMQIVATIWTSPWASNGTKVNWNDAPFEAHYRGFNINGCQVQNGISNQECNWSNSNYWWNEKKFWSLNPSQQRAYNNVRSKYLNYDWCTKDKGNPECQD